MRDHIRTRKPSEVPYHMKYSLILVFILCPSTPFTLSSKPSVTPCSAEAWLVVVGVSQRVRVSDRTLIRYR